MIIIYNIKIEHIVNKKDKKIKINIEKNKNLCYNSINEKKNRNN